MNLPWEERKGIVYGYTALGETESMVPAPDLRPQFRRRTTRTLGKRLQILRKTGLHFLLGDPQQRGIAIVQGDVLQTHLPHGAGNDRSLTHYRVLVRVLHSRHSDAHKPGAPLLGSIYLSQNASGGSSQQRLTGNSFVFRLERLMFAEQIGQRQVSSPQ